MTIIWSALLPSIVNRGIREAVPLLLAASGELFVELAGSVNIGIEGVMLCGAFAAAAAGWATGSVWLGLAAGAAAGAMVGLVFAAWTVWGARNQIVTGLAINLLAVGLTGVLVVQFERAAEAQGGEFVTPRLCQSDARSRTDNRLDTATDIKCDPVAWATVASVVAITIVLGYTRLGLSLKAVGENPEAADASGVPVVAIRTLAVVLGTAFVGLGGAYLTLGLSDRFQENMTGGRGFVALALVIFGRWSPPRVAAAALFFGLLDALQTSLQPYLGSAVHVLYPALLSLPYVATLIALAGFMGRAHPPAALGLSYRRAR